MEYSLDSSVSESDPIVTENTMSKVIAEWTSIPIGKLVMEETERLMLLEDDLTNRVKGQNRAVRSVSRAVRRARAGMRDTGRPVASFMFCGPTGKYRIGNNLNTIFGLSYTKLSSRTNFVI